MNIVEYIVYGIVFGILVYVVYFIPGNFVVKRLSIESSAVRLFLSITTGFVVSTILFYVLAWTKAIWLFYFFSIAYSYIYLKTKKSRTSKKTPLDFPLIGYLLFMSILFSIPMVTSGQFGENIRLLGVNNYDSFWHLSLINEMKTNFPPGNPSFADVPLRGYHFFYDFHLATISKLFFIPEMPLFFQFYPLFTALLWSVGVYQFMFLWVKNKVASLWAVFLTLFGGSFAFILPLQGRSGLSLDDAFGMTQPTSSLVNPPFSISIVLLISILMLFYLYIQKKEYTFLWVLAVFVGVLPMFKIYAGIIVLSGLGLLAVHEVMKKRFAFVGVFFPIGLIILGTYWVFTGKSGSLIWAPLWSPHKMVIDNLTWYGYTEKHYTYSRLSVIKGLIEIELYALSTFLFGNLGTRLFGLLCLPIVFFSKKTKKTFFPWIVIIMCFVSLIIPMFFIQSIKPFDIIQMTWYFLFFIALFASIGLGKFFQRLGNRKIVTACISLVLIAVTLPSAYEELRLYSVLSKNYLDASYIRSMHALRGVGSYNDTVLVIPGAAVSMQKKLLSGWYSGSKPDVPALANKRVYVGNQPFDLPGTHPEKRMALITSIVQTDAKYKKIENTTARNNLIKKIQKEKIRYIYSAEPITSLEQHGAIQIIYKNNTVRIYEVAYNSGA